MRGRGEQVPFVVVAPPVSQHQVLDGVDAAADPRDKVIGLWRGAEGPATLKALALLQGSSRGARPPASLCRAHRSSRAISSASL